MSGSERVDDAGTSDASLEPPSAEVSERARRGAFLLTSVFVVATAALLYELAAATLASYLVGSSALAFSVVLGVYLSAMGIGAFGARGVDYDTAARRFVWTEIALAVVGGTLVPGLLAAFALPRATFWIVLCLAVALVGGLVGLELPLLIRLVESERGFSRAVSRSLAADYGGGLLASVLFPLVLVPVLGLARGTLAVAMVNALLAAITAMVLRRAVPRARWLAVAALLLVACGGGAMLRIDTWTAAWTG